jgi:hypothetical protein
MMKMPNVPSEGFLKALPDVERRKLGRAGLTAEEAIVRFAAGKERELQKLIANWLLSEGHFFVRPRMDKKTTTAKGTPDFIACIRDAAGNGRFLCIEAKAGHGALTPEQASAMAEATASGAVYCVARSLENVIAVATTIQS